MGTVVNREDFSVEIDNVDPFNPGVLEFRLVIGRSIALQSFIKCSVDDMCLRLVQLKLVHILRLNCQDLLQKGVPFAKKSTLRLKPLLVLLRLRWDILHYPVSKTTRIAVVMIVEDPIPAFELDDSEATSTHGSGVCQDCERNCSDCFDIEKVVRKDSVGQIDSLRCCLAFWTLF